MKHGALIALAALVSASAIAVAAVPAVPVSDAAITGGAFPARLSEYGFFANGPAQLPSARVTPYRINTPLWSDGAEKLRFLYLPAGAQAKAAGEGLLDLPVGAALIKTFKFGAGKSGQLIETRVLLHRADGWVALPYLWNAEQTDARLVLAGARVPVTTPTGEAISYAVPNKNQCKECHASGSAVIPIGTKARNLSAEWLQQQRRAGRLDKVPAVARRVPLWEERHVGPVAPAARGYLDANCAHCHNPQGSASNSGLDLRWEQGNPHQYGVRKRPVAAGRGSGNFEFDIVPGDPDHSILTYRMASREGGVAMPEVGRATLDPDGLAIVRAWITALK